MCESILFTCKPCPVCNVGLVQGRHRKTANFHPSPSCSQNLTVVCPKISWNTT